MKKRLDGRLVFLTLLGLVVVGASVLQVLAPVLQQGLLITTYAYGNTTTSPSAPTAQYTVITPTTKAMPTVSSSPLATSTPTTDTMTGTVLAQDRFQRTDQPLWGMSSDGRTWAGDANTLTSFSITGTMGQIANGNGALNALLGPTKRNAEVLVQGTINHYHGAAVNLGVVLRWTNTNNWYKLLIDANTLSILKRVNGVSSTLASIPFHAQDTNSYMLRFRAVGAMLLGKAWLSNTTEPTDWMLVTNDTSLTRGQAGIRVLVQPTTIVHIAMFQATTATSSP